MREKWCVFISGTGSNFRALLDMKSTLNVNLLVSHKNQVVGLMRAKQYGVPSLILDNPINWEELSKKLNTFGITHIFLAGFMKIVPASFIQEWGSKIFNIHPSLLPLYPGLKSIERCFSEKGNLGVTIHAVTEGVDEGPVVQQKRMSLLGDLESTKIQVHRNEHIQMRQFALRLK